MKLLDKILYQRLDKIRDKLNLYITERIEEKLCETSIPKVEPIIQHNNIGGTAGKFLDVMRLEEDVDELEFSNEEYYDEECDTEEDVQIPFVPTYPRPTPQRPVSTLGRPMSSIRPVEINIPDFLRSECQKRSIDGVLESKAETFSNMLLRLIDEKGLKDSEVYKKANIDRRLFSKIRGDEDYVPSKKTAISFCLALQLSMDEAKKLLEAAGYALSTASRFDLIIMFLIENEEYNIHFANIVLEDYGEGTLSK